MIIKGIGHEKKKSSGIPMNSGDFPCFFLGNRWKRAFYKQTRGNFSKSLSYCEWDPVKIWYLLDFFCAQSLYECLKL